MTRENIQKTLGDAMMRLIRQKPFDEIRIADIVSEADVSRRTFYRFYHSKEALVQELIGMRFQAYFDLHFVSNGFEAIYPIAETIETCADNFRYMLAAKSGRQILTDTIGTMVAPYVSASIRRTPDASQNAAFINTVCRHFCGILVDLIALWLDGNVPPDIVDAKTFANHVLDETVKTTRAFGAMAEDVRS